MSSPAPPDRGLLWVISEILLYPFRLIYRLLRGLFGYTSDTIVILAPRAGDHVKQTFTVDGTIGSATPVSVTLMGQVTGGPIPSNTPQPTAYIWQVPFTVATTGSCTARATANGENPKTVDFYVDSAVLVQLDPPGFMPDPGPAATAVALEIAKSGKITFEGKIADMNKVKHPWAYLYDGKDVNHTTRLDETEISPKNDGTFKDRFKNKSVGPGSYVVKLAWVDNNKAHETSRYIVVS